jgi:hypothetical protein
MKFNSKLDFLKSFLKNPQKMASVIGAAAVITVGANKLSAQELSGIRDKSITPIVERAGHTLHSNTFVIQNFDKSSLDFLMKNFEYRYGKDVTNKLFKGTYNIGVEVGTNNFIIGNKPVSKKAYEQIILAMNISKVLNTPVDIRLGYNQRLNSFTISDIVLQGSVGTKKTATGISLTFPDGKKLSQYDVIQELKLSKKVTGSLRVINTTNSKLKNAYFGLQGYMDLSRKDKIFVPYVGVFGQKGKKAPDLNLGFFLKPNVNGKFSMYAEAAITKGKGSAFLRLSHAIGGGKTVSKPRDQLHSQQSKKSIFPKKIIRKGRK